MGNKPNQPILIIEDSPEDYEATLRAFRRSGLANPIYRCEDGDEALDYLYRRDNFENPATSPKPGLILLDLNLPGTDGREVLSEIKSDSELRHIPVIILTTSSQEEDIRKCYNYGANSYICKPISLESLVDSIRRLKDFWFEIVILPRGD